MNFCTPEDVVRYIKSARLAALMDRAVEGEELDSQLIAAVESANSEIGTYVRRQNPLPLLSIPPKLRQLAVHFAVVEIYRARSAKMPDSEADWHQQDIEYLKSIASGDVVLEFESNLQANQAVATVNTSAVTVQAPPYLFNSSAFRNYFPGGDYD